MYVARPAVAYRHIQIPITLLIEYAAGPGMIIDDGSCKLYVDHTRMYTHVMFSSMHTQLIANDWLWLLHAGPSAPARCNARCKSQI